MKTEKLSLKSIKNVLSRAEMKTIMAGSDGGGGGTGGGSGGCPNYGYAIPCCQCWVSSPACGNYVYINNSPPINTDCNCYCQSRGYAGGYNDCPISGC
jgi:hypothetical protein